MDTPSDQKQSLLRGQSSTLSDGSIGSNSTVVASPTTPKSPISHRSAYRRVGSIPEGIASYIETPTHQDTLTEGHGLGLENVETEKRASLPRKPVGKSSSPATPNATDSLLSPTLAKLSGKSYSPGEAPDDAVEGDGIYTHPNSSPYQPYSPNNDRERLHTRNVSGNTLNYEREFNCKTKRPFKSGRGSWVAVSILTLSIYSTIFSAIWLMIAIRKPRYGHTITTAGKLSPATASLLCAAFAKSIELSFVTVFVAFLGQLLSTRALVKKKGITIAEMAMRSWVMQPGTMLTHWVSVKYAALSLLGVLALLAALMAMVYTTASDALVSPKLKFGKTEHRMMHGKVAASFANSPYIEKQCTTPIPEQAGASAVDAATETQTCVSIEHAGESYHNYMQYLATWVGNIDTGNDTTDQAQRPDPVAVR